MRPSLWKATHELRHTDEMSQFDVRAIWNAAGTQKVRLILHNTHIKIHIYVHSNAPKRRPFRRHRAILEKTLTQKTAECDRCRAILCDRDSKKTTDPISQRLRDRDVHMEV